MFSFYYFKYSTVYIMNENLTRNKVFLKFLFKADIYYYFAVCYKQKEL